MKKSIYNHFSYSVYKYAPESFKLFFKGNKLELSSYTMNKYNFGYLAITDKNKLLDAIKQYIRNDTNLSNRISNKKLAIRTSDGSYINLTNPYGYGTVNIYNIQEKLEVYKALKEAYNINNTTIEVRTGTLGADGKMSKGIKQEIQKPELLKRVIFV